MTHRNTKKSKFLWDLVGLSYDMECEPEEWEALQLERYIKGDVDAIDYAAIEHKPNLATRASSANVLGALAQGVGNMIVSSADLANSDKTDGFLKKTKAFARGDFEAAIELYSRAAEVSSKSFL